MVDRYYTKQDFFYMMLRGIALPTLLIAKFGFLYGLLAYAFSQLIYYYVLTLMFSMRRLGALDEFFHLDNEKNRANIIVVVKHDKLTDEQYPVVRSRMIEISKKFDRVSHKLVKFFGEYFFVPLKGEALERAIDRAYVRNDTVKSDEQLA